MKEISFYSEDINKKREGFRKPIVVGRVKKSRNVLNIRFFCPSLDICELVPLTNIDLPFHINSKC